ncbi:MAG: hypothetical protein KKF62_13975 [Bacteroidetes bacterium]|nr:hypothetical protein [Bacteroidota bacterium]MBU1115266.1 hypothetical protein [Bacteroidota bacterium]MBU1798595.1 hypothetical protein [Bacteroidota bacterium]
MRTRFLLISFLFIAIFFIGCDEDSPTEPSSSSNSVTITGDITKSFDADCMAALVTEDTVSAFTVILQPKGSDISSGFYSNNMLTFSKYSNTLPAVGKYNIGTEMEGDEKFYSLFFANDSTFYFMYSGTVEITKSSSENISGKFDVQGSIFDYTNPDPTRIINVKGQFSTKPMNL